MAFGLLLRVTHTGKSAGSVHISDIRDGIDLLSGQGFRKPGAIYIPTPAHGGMALLVYSGDVAISFEGPKGGIRQFIDGGYLTAEFVAGSLFGTLLPSILDEGVLLTDTPTSIDFVGAGVTATTIGDDVTVTIPGGAGGGTHPGLAAPGLVWAVSGHTGAVDTLAGFDAGGAAVYYSRTVTGDVTGTFPGPLSVGDFTFPGEAQGDILYFDGANWALLPAGAAGEVLQTGGAGADPSWTSTPSAVNHDALNNLGWTVSGHTGAAGSLAAFNGATAAALLTGVSHGDIIYFNGTTWVRLAPGTVDGNPLTTTTAGSAPTWDNTIAVDTITESTGANGVAVNTIRNYGKSAANPGAPAPVDGDIYYNTALRMDMVYDGLRSKWLSAESNIFHFGRNGNTQAGQYYRAADGRVMSSTLGWYAERSGTVVSFAYTRTDLDAATFDIVGDGASLTTVASSAIGGRSIALNADFTFGQVLAVLNQAGGNTTSNVIAHIRVRWRV